MQSINLASTSRSKVKIDLTAEAGEGGNASEAFPEDILVSKIAQKVLNKVFMFSFSCRTMPALLNLAIDCPNLGP